ncbi:MAG: murein biosynthesis integral membrane protein MurJ [Thermodesulfobacteriota bacterium]
MREDIHKKKIAAGASIVASATALSRVLGYTRDMAIAYYFGAGALSDAFFVAFRISNLLRRLVGEGALTSSFIPIFQEERTRRDDAELKGLISGVFTLITLILLVLTFLGIFFSENLVALMSPGFLENPAKFTLTVNLTRLMFPYMIFVGLMAIGMGILNSLRHFTAPALAPVFFNIAIILSILIVSPFLTHPVYALAIGVLLGGAMQFAIMLPWLRRYGFLPEFSLNFRDSAILKIFKLMGPAAFGVGIYQLNIFITLWFASGLAEGSVSFLYYSGRLMELPLGIFGVAISTVALPGLAEYAAKEHWSAFMDSLLYALRLVLFLTIPAAIGLIILSPSIIDVLFAHGEFNEGATSSTAWALYFYAPGLVPVALYRIFTSAFYSLKDTVTPVAVAVVTLIINLFFCIVLVGPMKHAGLAFATTISALFNMVILFYLLRRKLHGFTGEGLFLSAMKNIIAAILMSIAVYLIFYGMGFNESRGLVNILSLGGTIIVGVIIYLLSSKLLKVPEVAFLKGFFIKGR